jgi:hypothetical protein
MKNVKNILIDKIEDEIVEYKRVVQTVLANYINRYGITMLFKIRYLNYLGDIYGTNFP